MCITSMLLRFQDSFGRAKTWVKELQRQASPNIVIALTGNKADLANKRAVNFDVGICIILKYKLDGSAILLFQIIFLCF